MSLQNKAAVERL